MGKRVILKLDGNLDCGVRVTLEIESDALPGSKKQLLLLGRLPANPDLAATVRDHWENRYRSIGAPFNPRIKPEEIIVDGNINEQMQQCRESAREVRRGLTEWLEAQEFKAIDKQLLREIDRAERPRVLICTDDPLLQKLPWHLWDFAEMHNAEVTLSLPNFQRLTTPKRNPKTKVRILAILGHCEGIDTDADRRLLENLPDAEVVFLVEPPRQHIHESLWAQPWDIIFFAGHSQTEGEEGKIYINPTDSLTIDELWFGLKQATKNGLQLAIFNSCDGLGLMRRLDDWQIPFTVVMRELVPDEVAQTFLTYFLKAFAKGKPFDRAVRVARERLQGLEDRYPCATWLPVIFQHQTAVPPTWEELQGKTHTPDAEFQWQRLPALLLAGLAMAGIVAGGRSTGILEPHELKAFDGLMRLRPEEQPDPRITIVTVTEADIQAQDALERRGSLSDATFDRLLAKLNPHQPRAIGLDIYRPFAVRSEYPELARQLQQNENLILICEIGGGDENPPIPPPENVPLARVGFSDLPIDGDGIVRRQFFGMSPGAECDTSQSFSFSLAYRYLSAEGIEFDRTGQNSFRIGSVEFPRVEPHSGGYNQLDAGGYQVMLNYRSSEAPAQTLTLGDVLADRFEPEWIRDRIIIIGTTARSIEDGLLTPYSAQYQPIAHIPGVFVQGQMVSQILSAVKDNRPVLWVLPGWGEFICIWVCAFAGATIGELLLSAFLPRKLQRLQWCIYMVASGAAIGIVGGMSFIALTAGVWLPLVPSGWALVLTGAGRLAIGNPRGEENFRVEGLWGTPIQ